MSHIIKHFEEFDITLSQSSQDNELCTKRVYTVQYGKQIKSGLNYSGAGKELGLCLMHAMYCESLPL